MALSRLITSMIKASGPITVYQYMQLALLHPTFGYYFRRPTCTKSSFVSPSGDFITSPEVSQVLGEMIGMHFMSHWQCKYSSNGVNDYQLIEMGPGNGTMLSDILRILSQSKDVLGSLRELHLLELCPTMRLNQRQMLEDVGLKFNIRFSFPDEVSNDSGSIAVFWHDYVESITQRYPSFILGHEFFDSFPIRQYYLADNKKWLEIYVQSQLTDTGEARPNGDLECVLRPSVSSDWSSNMIDRLSSKRNSSVFPSPGSIYELCPSSLEVYKRSLSLLGSKGLSIFVDYGYMQPSFRNSLRGIRDHTFVSPFIDPGNVDLSADVDFGFLSNVLKDEDLPFVATILRQNDYLSTLGIDFRVKKLLSSCSSPDEQQRLILGTEKLRDIGQAYRVLVTEPGKTQYTTI